MGQRIDLEDLKKDIFEKKETEYNISKKHFGNYLKYNKGIKNCINMEMKNRSKEDREIKVIFISGETGTGKTRYAMSYDTRENKIIIY